MSTEDKLNSVIALIEQYNSESDPEDVIKVADFNRKLKKMGGTSEELLSELKWEDIQGCGVPVLLARKIASVFRAPSAPSTEEIPSDPKFVSEKTAQRMPPIYLLQAYNPQDPTGPVAKRLKDLSRGFKFIVFKGDTSDINIDVSLRLLSEIMKGYPGRETIDVDGKPNRIYGIGDSRGETADENPLYPGRALRPDGTCDQINRSWDGVAHVVKQLLYIAAVKTGEVKVSYDKAHELRDMAEGEDAESRIRNRYSKASIHLDHLNDIGDAPKLKIKIGMAAAPKNDPFFAQHRTF
jgi:hypothetical protein